MFTDHNLWDTAWTLSTSPSSTVNTYVSARKSQGFDTVLMGYGGFGSGNRLLGNGQAPFLADFPFGGTVDCPSVANVADFTQPNPAGWAYIDQVITSAVAAGLFVAFLPAGNTCHDRYVAALQNVTVANQYGQFVGNRYKNIPQFLWVLGGDVDDADPNVPPLTEALANGIIAAGATQAITFHPVGGSSSMTFCSAPWLSFNAIQDQLPGDPSLVVSNDLSVCPLKPTGVAEHGYEGDPTLGYWTEQQLYDNTLAEYRAGASYASYGQASMFDGSNPSSTPGIVATVAARTCFLGGPCR